MSNRLKFRPRSMLLPVLMLVTGCQQGPSSPPTQTAFCYPVVPYTAEQQKAAAAELDALPATSELRAMISDYGRERDALRACASAK